jgi:FAD dependent oxidoreductase.
MRVAVLGGGIQGACTSLELALNGVEVNLYDPDPVFLEAVAHQEQALTAGPVKTSSEQLESVSDA